MSETKRKLANALLVVLYVVISIFLLLGAIYLVFEFKYADKIYPGTFIGGVNVGGKTLSESKALMNKRLDSVNQEGISFLYNDNKVVVYPINSSSDAEVVDVLIDFKVDETIEKAMAVGRNSNFVKNTIDKVSPFLGKDHRINLIINLDKEKVANYLKEGFSVLSPENASYYFDSEDNLSIKPGTAGKAIDFEKTIGILKNNLDSLNFSSITLKAIDSEPEISEADCSVMSADVVNVLDLTPVVLKYGKKEWTIDKERLLEFVILLKINGDLFVDLDKKKVRKYVEGEIASSIDQDAVLPKFTLGEGKVENFKPGKEGRKLDVDSTVNSLSRLPIFPFKELELPVSNVPISSATSGNEEILGIKEIIGEYTLRFDGSTSARISNIKNGAKSLNGLLLKSGEEFSMLKALGSIDEAHGYVKEAVIKGNSITYEFGGGLCHSSTTLFRAVLSAGLPITARKNHSYDMPYYTPAGVDATIYDPDPDFKFINDTPGHILIQAEVVNSSLSIELWGTNDGRVVNRTEPVMYNIVPPKPTKLVGTYTLATGKKKCTYAAYTGSDTYFDYEVAYPNGEVKKERFSSHYIPRQGVCLVGL